MKYTALKKKQIYFNLEKIKNNSVLNLILRKWSANLLSLGEVKIIDWLIRIDFIVEAYEKIFFSDRKAFGQFLCLHLCNNSVTTMITIKYTKSKLKKIIII